MDPDKLSELRAKHPRGLRVVELSDGRTFAFRRGGRAEYHQHRTAMLQLVTRPEVAATANEMLARSLCVYPSAEEFDALRDDNPAAASEIGGMLAEECGGAVQVLQGKP